MSRSNKNNGRKKLFENENETCCSSSSSSSNSEDGDVIITKVSSALESLPTPYPARALNNSNNSASLKGGSEAPSDLVYEYLTQDHCGREPVADEIRTNLKVVRIRKFQSNESKVLLIVDVPPASGPNLNNNNNNNDDDDDADQQQQQRRRRHLQQPPKKPSLMKREGDHCGYRRSSTKDVGLPTLIGSREIFELSDELARKFDVDEQTKSFEWRSFSRPDDVLKLLLNDADAKPVVSGAGGGGGHDTFKSCEMVAKSTPPMTRTGREKKNDLSSGGGSLRPAVKKKRISTCDDVRKLAVATGFAPNDVDDDRDRSSSDASQCHHGGRSRAVRNLLTKLDYVPRATDTASNVGRPAAVTAGSTPASTTDSNASAKTITIPTLAKYRDTMVDETWKPLKNCTTIRQKNDDSLHVLLGEDNVKGVSNCTADTSTSDANDDALNSSNSDDSDAKAKKKNRCALCRKKVGLTGFECRCGGLYCGMHRYSDKHNCTFDYRQLGAQEIRRNNPVVIGEKIQKI